MRHNIAACCIVVFLLAPAHAFAQTGLLEQAETRIANGAVSDARALLQRWQKEQAGKRSTDAEQHARYHLLWARTTTAADTAEDNYLAIALTYRTSKVAPEALLRLAQARSARGDSAQAITYLQRLLADYPASEYRALAAVWLARMQSPRGSDAALCTLLRSVASTNPETAQYLKTEQGRMCVASAASPAAINQSPAARVTIQAGAFRELSGARTMKAQLERAGFTGVRLVRVPDNALIRVRIGKYADRANAAPMLVRLTNAKINAVIVNDADRESAVNN